MKLVIKNEDLEFATQAVHRLVNAQSSLPILSNLLIKAEGERIIITASDLESSVRCNVPAQADEKFSFTVPATTFTSLVKELPDGDITLEVVEDKVTVCSASMRYQLATLDPIDFPAWPEFEPQATIEIQQPVLKKAFESVVFAIPTRDPRKVLLGAYLDIDELSFKCVGTDGKKLGFMQAEVEAHTGDAQINAIVPHKIMSEVMGALKDSGTCQILIGERQLAFNLGSVVYVTNKLDGAYPNYNRVIPQEFEKTLAMNKSQLSNTIRQAAIIAEAKNNSVKFRFADGELHIEANTYDVGSYAGSLPIEYDGEDFEMVFNHRFVSEVLRVIGAEDVQLKANKSVSPAVFQGAGDDSTLFVIMPIKLADLADGAQDE
ncbi:DNA polymerase III subunit beta [Candidatus Sumerlaeota bacterium]|nr:DNA polymerase III subunit beta [Candidatus Sumerlaeota bacterium]